MACQRQNDAPIHSLHRFCHILDDVITGAECGDFPVCFNRMARMFPHNEAAIQMCQALSGDFRFASPQGFAGNPLACRTPCSRNVQDFLCPCGALIDLQRDLFCCQESFRRAASQMLSQPRNTGAGNCVNCNFRRETAPHCRCADNKPKSTQQHARGNPKSEPQHTGCTPKGADGRPKSVSPHANCKQENVLLHTSRPEPLAQLLPFAQRCCVREVRRFLSCL